MKAFKIKRKSWHFHLATEYGNFNHRYLNGGLCYYLRRVILGAIKAIFIALILGAMTASFACLIIGAGLSVSYHFYLFTPWMVPAVAALVGLVLAFAQHGISTLCSKLYARFKQRSRVITPNTPGFITTAYRSYKEKTSIPIEIEPEEENK